MKTYLLSVAALIGFLAAMCVVISPAMAGCIYVSDRFGEDSATTTALCLLIVFVWIALVVPPIVKLMMWMADR